MRSVLPCLFILLPALCGLKPASAEETLKLKWEDSFLEIAGPQIPGGTIRIHYLEAYCRPASTDRDWHETVIPHESTLVSASEHGKRLVLKDELQDGVVVRHVIEAGDDTVHFEVTATNPTEKVSQVHWAQPCMRVDGFVGAAPEDARETYPPYIRKCFLMIDGEPVRLPTRPWALQARYTPGQVYAPADVDRDDVNPRPLSPLVPSSGLTGCFSADESMILAVAWDPYQEIFQGVVTCLHNDFRIGGLEPGETKTIRGRLYIVPADLDRLIARFRSDFPKQSSSD